MNLVHKLKTNHRLMIIQLNITNTDLIQETIQVITLQTQQKPHTVTIHNHITQIIHHIMEAIKLHIPKIMVTQIIALISIITPQEKTFLS